MRDEPTDDRGARPRELARVVTERFGLDADGYRHGPCTAERGADHSAERGADGANGVFGDVWTLVWTDGPTVEQVLRELGPEGDGEGPRCRRLLSEGTVALGAVRLAMGGAPGVRPGITPEAVERLWYDVPFSGPATDRERALVYAVVYEAHDNARGNRVGDGRICDLVAAAGLAWFLERMRVPLAPAEILTARYAAAHGHLAWKYRLTPMAVPTLLAAVRADRRASPELLTAALALASGPDGGADEATVTELRGRLGPRWP
ncbi:hypothetical protein [Streptomyces sp. NPDC056169]|uniref:hypothetical protein n=1 Tax=Streptomyces sp. NPDC056169 TaxID=3345734 RepID=UPI0035DE5D02